MEPSFWHARWNSGRIGFHNDRPHPLLQQHWSRLSAAPAASVLAPLCGKSLDLTWLSQQGHRVIGVELSEVAAEAYFAEAGRQPRTFTVGNFQCWCDAGVAILVGDWFQLTTVVLQRTCDEISASWPSAVYDRAALVALPESMRERYVESLTQLAGEAAWLLVTVEYDPALRGGPPFPLDERAVYGLHAARKVERVGQIDAPLRDIVVQETAYISRPE